MFSFFPPTMSSTCMISDYLAEMKKKGNTEAIDLFVEDIALKTACYNSKMSFSTCLKRAQLIVSELLKKKEAELRREEQCMKKYEALVKSDKKLKFLEEEEARIYRDFENNHYEASAFNKQSHDNHDEALKEERRLGQEHDRLLKLRNASCDAVEARMNELKKKAGVSVK